MTISDGLEERISYDPLGVICNISAWNYPWLVGVNVFVSALLAGNAVQLRLTVIRDDPAAPAVCIVRARSRDGEETGRKELFVPPAAGPIVLSTVVHTSRPPVTAEVYGCSFQVPAYLHPPRKY